MLEPIWVNARKGDSGRQGFVFKGGSKTPGKGKRNRIDSIRWNMGAGANIHDRFFKETLSHVQIARDFLENYLPPHVIRHIDLRTLRISKDSFVREAKEQRSDLLYRVNLHSGDEALIYFLFEHKSRPDPYIAFQLLRVHE